jgi:uncharacterized protein YkwD
VNPLDVVILLILLASIIAGIRRGFLVGVYDMLVAALSLVFAALTYPAFADLIGTVLDFSAPTRNLLGFVLAYIVAGLPGALLIRPLIRRFRALTGIVPGVNPIDRLLGAMPGAVQGVIVAFVLVLVMGFFSTSTLVGDWLENSEIGVRLYRSGSTRVLETAGAAGFEPSEFFALTRQASSGGHVLPFRVDAEDLRANPEAEADMLELVNAERRARGLQPLELDAELVAVARLHAIDMYSEGYFSHTSPTTGSPFDRLDARGITYNLAGENLAYAPDVETAHQGLMDSPGHRENILEPGFGRVGIGVVESRLRGTMYVQVFTN